MTQTTRFELPLRLPRHLRPPRRDRGGTRHLGAGRPRTRLHARSPLPQGQRLREDGARLVATPDPAPSSREKRSRSIPPGELGRGRRPHRREVEDPHRKPWPPVHTPRLLRGDHGPRAPKRAAPALPPHGRLAARSHHLQPGQRRRLEPGDGRHPRARPGRSGEERPRHPLGVQRAGDQPPLPHPPEGRPPGPGPGLSHRHLPPANGGTGRPRLFGSPRLRWRPRAGHAPRAGPRGAPRPSLLGRTHAGVGRARGRGAAGVLATARGGAHRPHRPRDRRARPRLRSRPSALHSPRGRAVALRKRRHHDTRTPLLAGGRRGLGKGGRRAVGQHRHRSCLRPHEPHAARF